MRESGLTSYETEEEESVLDPTWKWPSTGGVGLTPGRVSSFYIGMEVVYVESSQHLEIIKYIRELEKEIAILSKKISIFPVALNSLDSDKWDLRKPLTINVEQRDIDEFVACFYDADIYGYGDSIPEALEDLKSAMIEQLEILLEEEKNGTELCRLPEKQLKILRNFITNKQR